MLGDTPTLSLISCLNQDENIMILIRFFRGEVIRNQRSMDWGVLFDSCVNNAASIIIMNDVIAMMVKRKGASHSVICRPAEIPGFSVATNDSR